MLNVSVDYDSFTNCTYNEIDAIILFINFLLLAIPRSIIL